MNNDVPSSNGDDSLRSSLQSSKSDGDSSNKPASSSSCSEEGILSQVLIQGKIRPQLNRIGSSSTDITQMERFLQSNPQAKNKLLKKKSIKAAELFGEIDNEENERLSRIDEDAAPIPELVAGKRSRLEQELIRERLKDVIQAISYDTLIMLKQGIMENRLEIEERMRSTFGRGIGSLTSFNDKTLSSESLPSAIISEEQLKAQDDEEKYEEEEEVEEAFIYREQPQSIFALVDNQEGTPHGSPQKDALPQFVQGITQSPEKSAHKVSKAWMRLRRSTPKYLSRHQSQKLLSRHRSQTIKPFVNESEDYLNASEDKDTSSSYESKIESKIESSEVSAFQTDSLFKSSTHNVDEEDRGARLDLAKQRVRSSIYATQRLNWERKVTMSNLRFVKHQLREQMRHFEDDEDEGDACGAIKEFCQNQLCCCCQKNDKNGDDLEDSQKNGINGKWSDLSPREKSERLAYLRFRMRIIAITSSWLRWLRQLQHKNHEAKMRIQLKRIVEKPLKREEAEDGQYDQYIAEKIWFCVLCCVQWFNLATTPAIMVFPEMTQQLESYFYLNEFIWLLDIVRKLLFQNIPGQDTYTSAVNYIKSTLILDVIALLPQILYNMDPDYALFKNVRIYQIWLLYYPAQWLINNCPSIKGEHHIHVLTYAISTFTKITVLLHYLGCLFIYIGSERFVDFEEDHVPWTIANSDFHGMSNVELMIFADYWVCTVVTTVGYGDYTGSTSLEYVFTFSIEFFGFLIFAALQIGILQILKIESSFTAFVSNRDFEVLKWLLRIEQSATPSRQQLMPELLYNDIKSHMDQAYRKNFDLVTQYGFYYQLPPKLQTELIDLIFSRFLNLFDDTFRGCERAFVNRIIVSLRYKSFLHNAWIYRGKFNVSEAYFVVRGGVAVCESTCYTEPITVYQPGAFFLMYQALLDHAISFDYLAIASDSQILQDGKVCFNASEQTYFLRRAAREKANNFHSSLSKSFLSSRRAGNKRKEQLENLIELLAIDKESLKRACELFPDSSQLLQARSIKQIERLSQVRQYRQHLHDGNYNVVYYRKKQASMETRAPINLSIEIKNMNDLQLKNRLQNLQVFLELQIDLLTFRARSFGEQMELIFAKHFLDKRKRQKLKRTLVSKRLDSNAFEMRQKLSKQKLLQKYRLYEKVTSLDQFEEVMQKSGQPIFLKELPSEDKDDPRCSLIRQLDQSLQKKKKTPQGVVWRNPMHMASSDDALFYQSVYLRYTTMGLYKRSSGKI